MQPRNLLFIMSDEHAASVIGAAGHPVAKMPNLDALAARGTLFSSAYTPSPICVPARAAFATGRYDHETGNWDNGHPWDGSVPGWGHALQAAGRPVLSIGKLHYRGEADPTGFDTQIRPMHVVDGKGDVYGAIKDPMPIRFGGAKFSREVGPGESGYTRYDRAIADEAVRWLMEAAPAAEGPWGAVRLLRLPAFPADCAGAVLRPLRPGGDAAAEGLPPAPPAIPGSRPMPRPSPMTASSTTRCGGSPLPPITGSAPSSTTISAVCWPRWRAQGSPGARA